MEHYETNSDFMSALAAFLARHGRLLKTEKKLVVEDLLNRHHYWQTQQIMQEATGSGDEATFNEAARWTAAIWRRQENLREPVRRHNAFLAHYLKELENLAFEWGLRADWAANHLHHAVVLFLTSPGRLLQLMDLTDLGLPHEGIPYCRIVVDVTYHPSHPPAPEGRLRDLTKQYEKVPDPRSPIGSTIMVWYGDWDAVEAAIVEEAKRQRDAIRAQLAERADVSIRDTESALDRHVYWLYLHICPQEDFGRPLGWKAIQQREGASVKTIRDAVSSLAHELGITLPQLRSIPLSRSR